MFSGDRHGRGLSPKPPAACSRTLSELRGPDRERGEHARYPGARLGHGCHPRNPRFKIPGFVELAYRSPEIVRDPSSATQDDSYWRAESTSGDPSAVRLCRGEAQSLFGEAPEQCTRGRMRSPDPDSIRVIRVIRGSRFPSASRIGRARRLAAQSTQLSDLHRNDTIWSCPGYHWLMFSQAFRSVFNWLRTSGIQSRLKRHRLA